MLYEQIKRSILVVKFSFDPDFLIIRSGIYPQIYGLIITNFISIILMIFCILSEVR